jgi:nucleotide-binding universal stress UspA family protein
VKVLLAVDGSEGALRAARFVVQLFAGRQAEVQVVNVQPAVAFEDLLPPQTRARIDRMIAERGRLAADAALEVLAAGGISGRVEVRSGDAAPVIVTAARELGCELIIVGTRGLGSVAGLALGSVAAKVIQLAEVPVTVVK